MKVAPDLMPYTCIQVKVNQNRLISKFCPSIVLLGLTDLSSLSALLSKCQFQQYSSHVTLRPRALHLAHPRNALFHGVLHI